MYTLLHKAMVFYKMFDNITLELHNIKYNYNLQLGYYSFYELIFNLPEKEDINTEKVHFQHIFTILHWNDLDLDLITVNIYYQLKKHNIVNNIKLYF